MLWKSIIICEISGQKMVISCVARLQIMHFEAIMLNLKDFS